MSTHYLRQRLDQWPKVFVSQNLGLYFVANNRAEADQLLERDSWKETELYVVPTYPRHIWNVSDGSVKRVRDFRDDNAVGGYWFPCSAAQAQDWEEKHGR